MDKEQAIKNIKQNTCPSCLTKNSLWLDEEGGSHESYVCNKCETEVMFQMERVVKNIDMYIPKTDEEINLM